MNLNGTNPKVYSFGYSLLMLVTLIPGLLFAAEEHARLPNNWNKWGEEDQLGAANYIEPENLISAAKLIRRGKIFSLAIPLNHEGPVFPGRLAPHHTMVLTGADYQAGLGNTIGSMKFADDYLYMPLQGSTQWDGLSHAWYDEFLYNGVHQSAIRSAPSAGGATRLGIENVKNSLVGRGILVDIVEYKEGNLPTGYMITRKDIENTLKEQNTIVRKGDIVLIRTGVVPGYYKMTGSIDRSTYMLGPQAGIGPDVIDWIDENKIAAIAADNITLEVFPNPDPGKNLSIHGSLLRDLGVYIGEIWWLEELAGDCYEDGIYEFFLAAQPLNITGAVGSPINPVAIK